MKYLEQQQKPDGRWADFTGTAGGDDRPVHAGPAECRRRAGRPQRRPRAAGPAQARSRPDLTNTYALSLQTMVFCRAKPEKYLLQIQPNVEWLQQHQITDGPRRGAWSYPRRRQRRQLEQPVRPAGPLRGRAGRRAAHVNIHVNDRTWRLAKAYWEGCQNPDGSWGYYKDQPGTGSMTCAGITSLIIASDMIHQADARVDGDQIDCCGQGDVENDRIEQGMTWLGRHFIVTGNPGAARADCGALLSLRPGAGRPAHRPAVHRRPRLVPRRRRPVWSASRATWPTASGKGPAMPRTTRTSAPAWPCCSSPRAAGRCCWPSSTTARAKTGTSTATTWTT